MTMALRTGGDSLRLAAVVRCALREPNPGAPILRMDAMTRIVREATVHGRGVPWGTSCEEEWGANGSLEFDFGFGDLPVWGYLVILVMRNG